jgi:hypothetical protein
MWAESVHFGFETPRFTTSLRFRFGLPSDLPAVVVFLDSESGGQQALKGLLVERQVSPRQIGPA